MDELWDEYERDIGSRNPDGSSIGGSSLSPNRAKELALKNAEKRKKISLIMIPSGGRVLGGSGLASRAKTSARDLRKLAADAAERRAKDSKWCASGHNNVIELQDSDDDDITILPAAASSSNVQTVKMVDPEIIIISSDEEDFAN